MNRILTCMAAALLLAACSSHHETPSEGASGTGRPRPSQPAAGAVPSAAARTAVRAVVERFGKRMQTISVLAPANAVRGELAATYGTLITPGLMETWKAHPDKVVGREGSSPWPTQIVVHAIDCGGQDACHVTGKVDYVTSNEVEHGGVLYRRGIALDVARTASGWRIAAVKLGPAPG